MLTDNQKSIRIDISRYLLSRYEGDPGDFFERVVTQDETWVHHFDQESKCRANNGRTLAHPLLRNLRVFIQQGRGLHQFFGKFSVIMIDYLEQGRLGSAVAQW